MESFQQSPEEPPPDVTVRCQVRVVGGGCLGRGKRPVRRLRWDESTAAEKDEPPPPDDDGSYLRLWRAQKLFANGQPRFQSEAFLVEHFDTKMLGVMRSVDALFKSSRERTRASLLATLTAHFPTQVVPFSFDINNIFGQLLLEVRDFEWMHTKLNHILMCDKRVNHSPLADWHEELTTSPACCSPDDFHASYFVFTPAFLGLSEKPNSINESDGEEGSSLIACHTRSDNSDDEDFSFPTEEEEEGADDHDHDGEDTASNSNGVTAEDEDELVADKLSTELHCHFEAEQDEDVFACLNIGPSRAATRGLIVPFGPRIRSLKIYLGVLRSLKEANESCVLLGLVVDEILNSLDGSVEMSCTSMVSTNLAVGEELTPLSSSSMSLASCSSCSV